MAFRPQPDRFKLQPACFKLQPERFKLQPGRFKLQPEGFKTDSSFNFAQQIRKLSFECSGNPFKLTDFSLSGPNR